VWQAVEAGWGADRLATELAAHTRRRS